jgi:hypothetical protein
MRESEKNMKKLVLRFVATVFLVFPVFQQKICYSQDSTVAQRHDGASTIRLRAFVENTEVPQNRLADLVIRLEWSGDLDRYDIHRFDNPVLQNLQIQGSGSANRVATSDGVQTAIREYTFALKPQAIGMAYVEPMIITYTDRVTDESYRLTTNRIQIKVVEPVPDAASVNWIVWLLVAIVVVGGGIVIIRAISKKRTRQQKMAQEKAEAAVPIEEKYLGELKEFVALDDVTLDNAKAFSDMSKLLRRFLHERYAAPGLEATTSEVTQFLYSENFSDRIVNEIKEILSNADIIKFSGKPVDRPEVERTYTLVESLIQKSLRNEIGTSNQSVT